MVIFLSKVKIQALLLAVTLAGCAVVAPNLPAITDEPTGSRYNGRFVWHDLLTTTPEASRKFYGELFGWEFENPGLNLGFGSDGSYMLIRHNGRLIGGMVDANTMNRDENISQWVSVMSVEDINTAAERVIADGGEILTPPTDVGSRGTLAVATGPDGALFALVQTKDGDPAESEPANNSWLWNELWTDDIDRAAEFYKGVAGLSVVERQAGDSESPYRMLMAGDKPRAGILTMPFEGERPVWVSYIRVEDPAAITAQVTDLGGKVYVDVQDRAIGGQAAMIAGPSGAGVALQTWPLN